MRIRCADPFSFTATVTLKQGSTIADLKEALQNQYDFNASSCIVFSREKEWKDNAVIRAKKDDQWLFVFFDRESFYDKSYPAFDDAFRFPETRFGRPPAPLLGELARNRPPQRQEIVRRPRVADEQLFQYEIEGTTISLTAREEAAVRRLMEQGLDFQIVLQVFVACERNENAALECLRGMH